MKFFRPVLAAILISFSLAFSILAQASDALTQQFASEFYNQYQSGKCGQNIMNLVDRAAARGIDISQAHIIEIKNGGFSVFGLLRAEYARGAGKLYNSPGPGGIRWMPGGTNWQFHAILELDGLIYDFDFGNEPIVLPVAQYFEQMFLDEKETGQYAMFHVGRDEKLSHYELTVISALDIKNRRGSAREEKMSLGRYLSRR